MTTESDRPVGIPNSNPNPNDLLLNYLTEGKDQPWQKANILVTVGEGCEPVISSWTAKDMILELVNNCVEKKVPIGFDKIVSVNLSRDHDTRMYFLTIEDNITHTCDEITGILKNLKSKKPKRMGKCDERMLLCSDEGRLSGMNMVKTYLSKWGGDLTYEATNDNRIVTKASWSADQFDEYLKTK